MKKILLALLIVLIATPAFTGNTAFKNKTRADQLTGGFIPSDVFQNIGGQSATFNTIQIDTTIRTIDVTSYSGGSVTINKHAIFNDSSGRHNFQVKTDNKPNAFVINGELDLINMNTSVNVTEGINFGTTTTPNVKNGKCFWHITHNHWACSDGVNWKTFSSTN